MKRKIALLITTLVLVANLAVFAATSTNNNTTSTTTTRLNLARGYGAQFMASVVSKLTGLKTDEVLDLKAQGKTFYEIALSKGVTADKFKDTVYQEKSAYVDQKVKDGVITKEQADAIKAQMKSRIDNCNGQGYTNRPQNGYGIFGNGGGQNQGRGMGNGRGAAQGRGAGQGYGMRGFSN
ncbi:hypothetical protein ACAG39_04015 [Caldicellulosiruptoraceae bacterium PP1]